MFFYPNFTNNLSFEFWCDMFNSAPCNSSLRPYSFILNGFLCNYHISLWLFLYPERKPVHMHRSEHLFQLFNGPCTLPWPLLSQRLSARADMVSLKAWFPLVLSIVRIGDFYDLSTSGILTTIGNTPSQTSQTVGYFYDVIGRIGSISTLKVLSQTSPTSAI